MIRMIVRKTLRAAQERYDFIPKGKHQAALDRIDRLEAENKALREALKPFADKFYYYTSSEFECAIRVEGAIVPTVADCRRAAEILAAQGKDDG